MARVANGFFELLIRARLFFTAEMAGFTSYNRAVLLREMSSAGLHVVINHLEVFEHYSASWIEYHKTLERLNKFT